MTRSKPVSQFFESLRIRLLTLSVLFFGVLAGAVIFNGDRVIRKAMEKNISVTVKQTSEILNLAVSPYAIDNELETLGVFLDELLAKKPEDGLVYIVAGRDDGSILMQSGWSGGALPEPDTEQSYPEAAARGTAHIRHPLLLSNNKVGFLQYGLSFRFLLDASERANQQGILLVLAGMGGGSIVFLMIGLRVVRRLDSLVSASQAIAYGDYTHRAPIMGHDEISQLARHFNLMADAIQQRMLEITRLNQSLEQRVEARTRELRELNETLRQANENLNSTRDSLVRSEKLASLGALVAGVAHELNTPLGNAVTVASTLHAQTNELAAEFKTGLRRSTLENYIDSARAASDLIMRNLDRASGLVTNFKHVAVDRTSEMRRRFDLRQVIEEVVSTLAPSLKRTPYVVEIGIPAGIVLDSYPGPLGQIVVNLIDNAVIHGFRERAHGNIRLSCGHSGADVVRLECRDDGHGIPPEHLKRIFDPFFTTRLGQGGSGLGMSIVHNLVYNVLGGAIQVESELGAGTCFVIEIPMMAPETVSGHARSPAGPQPPKG